MTLHDAVATSLHLVMVRRFGVEFCHHDEDACAILADEAFRTALGASLAEAEVARLNEDPDALGKYIPEDLALWAAGVVERMLA